MEEPNKPIEVVVNFKMDRELNIKLKALAKKRGISFAGLMRNLGITELERENNPANRANLRTR